MAFSLLDHLQNNQSAALQQLTNDQAIQRQMIAVMLAQLVVRDRQESTVVYQAIQQQKDAVLWQGVDQQAIEQLAALYDMPATPFKNITEQLYVYAAQEIKALDDAANLKQAGVSELIQGQIDYLPHQAPDQAWQLLGLTELQGQSLNSSQPVDLNSSIASLSKMMHEASQATYVNSHDPLAHENSQSIELPYQRSTPHVFLILEPLLALIILIMLWVIYMNLSI